MAEQLNIIGQEDGSTSSRRPATFIVAIGVVLFFGAVGYLITIGGLGAKRKSLPTSFQLNLEHQLEIAPEWPRYQLAEEVKLSLQDARAFACRSKGGLVVANQRAVHMLSQQGEVQQVISLTQPAVCLAVGAAEHEKPDRIYVGTPQGVQVFDSNGEPVATWPKPNEESLLTSIAVAEQDVFLADAGSRAIWRFDIAGEPLGRIDLPTDFALPARHFDIAIAAEDLLFAVNPGRLQIVTFTFAGDRGAGWGKAGSSITSFFGCCNPMHIAVLGDGRLVTSEKGIPRVKVYSPSGALEAVVAAPQQLGVRVEALGDPRIAALQAGFPVAVDQDGRVLVLDPVNSIVRVFAPGNDLAAAESQT